ncbi:Putative FKBP-type peptidyl-prolyl cis-trans isomerase [uncultured archaeon]|nr:Putative FKBP-type peptidyl-prolyl cis-trans isomerase [uncultured archaeon]
MVSAKKGDLVRMEYTGKVAATGMVFDTTDESIAKKSGIWEQSTVYGPKLAVFGSKTIIPGIEEAILSSQLGKSAEFTIGADKAFGEKIPSLIRMMPEREFAKQGVRPVMGMVLALDGMPAMVKSITSGRVVVDFNHPLSGESVHYTLKVTEVISDEKKKLEALLAAAGVKGAVSEKGGKLEISIEKPVDKGKLEQAKRLIAAIVPGTAFA